MKIYLFFLMMFLSAPSSATDADLVTLCEAENNSEISIVKSVLPNYPTDLYDTPEGWVKLQVIVDLNGKAIEITIMDAEPKHVFERSAKKAINKWEFSKSISEKKRCGIITLEFKLE